MTPSKSTWSIAFTRASQTAKLTGIPCCKCWKDSYWDTNRFGWRPWKNRNQLCEWPNHGFHFCKTLGKYVNYWKNNAWATCQRFDKRSNPLLSGIFHQLSQSNDSSFAYPIHNDIMKALYVHLLWSGETTGTDKPEEPKPPLEQEHQNGQRLRKRKLPLQTKTALEIRHCPLLFFLRSDPNWLSLKQLVKDQIFKAAPTLLPTSVQAEGAFTAL